MPATPLRALIVEDSEDDAELLVRELQRSGYHVDWTRADSEASLTAALTRQSWDVVLSDFTLPGFAGFDALKLVQARALDIPFIFVSGTIGEERAVQAMKEGAHDYILKGNLARLVPALRRELRESASRRERRRAENLLAQSEERYRVLFDANPFPMWVFDLETLRFLEVNDAAVRDYGYSREEFLAMTIEAVRPPEDVGPLRADVGAMPSRRQSGATSLRPVDADQERLGSWRHRKKNGAVITVDLFRYTLDFQGRPAALVLVQDVTRRAEGERRLAAQFAVTRALAESAAFDEAAPKILAAVGELLQWEVGAVWMRDQSADVLRCMTFWRRPGVEAYAFERRSRELALRRGEGLPGRAWAAGQTCWIDDVAKTPGLPRAQVALADGLHAGVAVPITHGNEVLSVIEFLGATARPSEAVMAIVQATLGTQIGEHIVRSRTEGRLRALVDSALDAVVTMDASGKITGWNAQAERVFGWPAAEALGRSLADTIIPPEHRAAHGQGLASFLTTGHGPILGQRIEINALRRDGTEFPVELTVSSARLGQDWLFCAFLRDITERRQLELQLRQSQKMEAVGRLAGGVAHDFNNVLTAVFGYVDLLREEIPADSGAQHDLLEIRKAAERAAGLTRQLLAFSRQQVLEPVVLRPKELVEDLEKMLQRMIGEDVELKLALKADVGNVRADPGQLQQVLMNLVVNARDAMPRGGKLLIEASNAELTEQYAELHQPVIPGRYVMLAVSDTGSGMSEEVKAHIFEPFFTTKEQGKGTGLGLSMVYGIVKQSGGYIWVYSEVGRGTTFKIYLPCVDGPAATLHRAREGGVTTGTETILLAEDDAMLRPLAKGLLEKLGYRVIDSENAAQALEAARQFSGPIHLLVADVVMPGGSGRDLARELADTRPETKVLYVSGYTDDAIVHHGMLEPGLNFLQKPFTPAVLARKVREVLDAPPQ